MIEDRETEQMKHKELLDNVLNFILGQFKNVSDINFSPGNFPHVERNGELIKVQLPSCKNFLTPSQTKMLASVILDNNKSLLKKLTREGSVDLSYSLPNRARFRVNIFSQRGSYAIVLRVIPTRIPTMEELNLPPVLKEICKEKNGLVLVTGPTGSGKSSTMASIVDMINSLYSYHIITIEDPIEYLHQNRKSIINQREIGTDAVSFKSALRGALRQSPKVVLVGEMRDRETIEIALEACETGHLVISTLHTIDAPKTVDRIVGVFPKNEEQAVRRRIASTIKWIVSQRLIPSMDSRRIAAVEILRTSERTRDYIVNGEKEGKSLHDVMKDGHSNLGMQTFDMVIMHYVRKGIITPETGIIFATKPNDLIMELSKDRDISEFDDIELDISGKGHIDIDVWRKPAASAKEKGGRG